jgi:Glycosyltransferase family 87
METGQSPANSTPARNGPLLVFLLLLAAILIMKHNAPESALRFWDFQAFYVGAEMVSHGEGSRLYDFSGQAAAQMRYVDPTRQVTLPDMPFLYPAAITLLFLPFVKFSMAAAYASWTVINLLVLVATVRLLQKMLPLPHDNRPVLAAVLFAPVYACLLTGQVSVVILFLVTLAYYFLIRSRPLLAGFAIGLATLKFQVVLGLLAVLALRRMWRVLAGSAIGGSVVAGVSVWITGWRAAAHYPEYLRQVAYHERVAYTPYIVNLRGLLWQLVRHEPTVWLVALLSVAFLILAAVIWNDVATGFSIAVTVSVLTSFHAHYYELSLLLLPFAVLIPRVRWNRALIGTAALIILASSLILIPRLETLFSVLLEGLVIFGLWRTRPTMEGRITSERDVMVVT